MQAVIAAIDGCRNWSVRHPMPRVFGDMRPQTGGSSGLPDMRTRRFTSGQFRPLDKSPKIADNPTAYESEHVRLTVCGFSLRRREDAHISRYARCAQPVWVLAASHNGGTKWLCTQQSFAAENVCSDRPWSGTM
jgi:hypothetical protein